MITVSSILDSIWYERYKAISRLNLSSSIYDITDKCNLTCRGCFFYASDHPVSMVEEHKKANWELFVENETKKGIKLAILIGGEPALELDRVELFYKKMKVLCTTNGLIKIPKDRFPDIRIAISLWGDKGEELRLRGIDTFSQSSANYAGDSRVYYVYNISPNQVGQTESVIKKVKNIGLTVHPQLLLDGAQSNNFPWEKSLLAELRAELDSILDTYPDTFISTKFFHQVLTTRQLFSRTFGWNECPSVSEKADDRQPKPKRMTGFNRWASDLKTIHECCVSKVRNCDECADSAALMSWILVNKRDHIKTTETLQNWIEVVEMFAKLNGLS